MVAVTLGAHDLTPPATPNLTREFYAPFQRRYIEHDPGNRRGHMPFFSFTMGPELAELKACRWVSELTCELEVAKLILETDTKDSGF